MVRKKVQSVEETQAQCRERNGAVHDLEKEA